MPAKKPHDTQHLAPRESMRMRSSVQQAQLSKRISTTAPSATHIQFIKSSGSPSQKIHPAARAHAIRRQRKQAAMQQAAAQTGIEQPQQVGVQIDYTQQLGNQPQQHGVNIPQLVKLAPREPMQMRSSTQRLQPNARIQTTAQPPGTRTRLTRRSRFSAQEIERSTARAHTIQPQQRQTTAQTGVEQPRQPGVQIEYTQQLGNQSQQHGANVPQLVKLAPGTVLQFDFDTGRITVA
mgnify:CR=1 FL=1